MGKTASMDREGRQEAGIFLLNILEEVFSKIMKKFKANHLALVILVLSLLHKLKENGTMQVLAAITKQVNDK